MTDEEELQLRELLALLDDAIRNGHTDHATGYLAAARRLLATPATKVDL